MIQGIILCHQPSVENLVYFFFSKVTLFSNFSEWQSALGIPNGFHFHNTSFKRQNPFNTRKKKPTGNIFQRNKAFSQSFFSPFETLSPHILKKK